MDKKSNLFSLYQNFRSKEGVFDTMNLLSNVIDTVSNFFLIWDQNDCLAVYNKKLFDFFPDTRGIYVVGRTFREILYMGFEFGVFEVPEKMTVEEWIKHRLDLHKRGIYFEVQQIKDRWIQVRDQRTEDGYIFTTGIDVTHLKKQEEELILAKERADKAENLLRDALDTMSDGCSLWDKDDRFILSNRKLFNLYPNIKHIYVPGHSYEEILRRGIEKGDFTVPDNMTKEEWIKKRTTLHKSGNHKYEKRVKSKWLQIRDQRTIQGNIITTATDITPLKEEVQQLEFALKRDSLTGLLNHDTIQKSLATQVLQAERQETPLSLALIDIDKFKTINDTYGHPAGNHIIKALSCYLEKNLRRTDIIGRYGGDEFAIILLNTSGQEARKAIDKVRRGFAKLKHTACDQQIINVSFSAGLADYPTIQSCTDLIEIADKKLYDAKRKGRNCTVLHKVKKKS